MITGFDHYIVVVNNLEAAMQAYRRLGFQVQAGGEHPSFGSHNALIAFADATYLELVAFKDPMLAAKSFWKAGVERLRAGEGFVGYVLGSNDIVNDAPQLSRRSLAYGEPQSGHRVRPDGQRVEWRTSLFAESPVGAMPFLIQDVTPRQLRITPPEEGLGSRARVTEIVVAVKDVDQARDAYRGLMDLEPKRVHNAAGDVAGYRITAGWGSIVLARPEQGGNAMADQLARRGEGLYALTLQIQGLGRDRIRLRNQGVDLQPDGNGFLVAPESACGARLRLT